MNKIIKSAITEYGVKWTINRGLYSMKLKVMKKIPRTENLFEKKVDVQRIDIFDIDSYKIKDFLLNLPNEEKEKIISLADEAINGKIKGFSSIELDYGNPIDWHLNPLTGESSDKQKKWYEISDFNKELGDIKVIWEASRLTQFFYFTRAYMITGDVKYYNAFSTQLEDWLKNNKYSYGANYKCGQECALRMINTLMAYSIFKQYELVTNKDINNIKNLVEGSYKKILSNFFYAHKCINNNHTFSEISGLIVGSWCCNDDEKLRKSYNLLDQEIRKQFLEDGGFTQYSFNYQRFTLQIIECIYKISDKTGIKINEETRIKNSVMLMYQVQDISGDVPNYGSNDGALIFPVSSCEYRDFRPVLNTVYALVTGKRLYQSGIYDEELLWFGNREYNQIDEIEKKSSKFDKIGFYVLRKKNTFLVTYLQDYKSRPAHMDQLHIDLWYYGLNIFCDGGTYSYASEEGDFLSKTKAHNVIQIDYKNQMDKPSNFMVCNWTKSHDVKFMNNEFSGTIISKNGYRHTRNIRQSIDGYIIEDEIYGNGQYCNMYLHTPFKVQLEQDKIIIYDDELIICTINTNADEIKLEETYRSLYYMKKELTNCICLRKKIINKQCNITSSITIIDERER